MKKVIFTPNAPEPIGPYSQAYLCDNTLYCSGQIALDAKTGEFLNGTIEEQTEKVIANISEVLKVAGYDFNDVIKTTCFLAQMSDFSAFNSVYGKYFITRSYVVISDTHLYIRQLPRVFFMLGIAEKKMFPLVIQSDF